MTKECGSCDSWRYRNKDDNNETVGICHLYPIGEAVMEKWWCQKWTEFEIGD